MHLFVNATFLIRIASVVRILSTELSITLVYKSIPFEVLSVETHLVAHSSVTPGSFSLAPEEYKISRTYSDA